VFAVLFCSSVFSFRIDYLLTIADPLLFIPLQLAAPEGEPFFWIEVYTDGFETFSTRSRSATGLYVGFTNLKRAHRYNEDHIHTLMLLPPGIELNEALAEFTKDTQRLTAGIDIPMYPDGRVSRIKAAIAFLVGDHPQQCHNCSHLGNNSVKNCRFCMVNKVARTKFDLGILDWQNTRSSAQSDAIRTQMQHEFGDQPSQSKKEVIRRQYGIREQLPVLHGLVDPHRQGLICVGHCIDLGLLSRLVEAMVGQVEAEDTLQIVESRLNAFPYPREWSRVTSKLLCLKGRKKQAYECCTQNCPHGCFSLSRPGSSRAASTHPSSPLTTQENYELQTH
jgi:hypothetical protein